MANSNNPTGNGLSVNLLPDFYQTTANKKFLQATIDQLYQPGTLTKTTGYIGRRNAKAASGPDVYVAAADATRRHYQLEPGIVVQDTLGNVTFFKDYIDYINQLKVFGSITSNHERLNKQEFYSWDPHIDWDKFVNFQNYYWLPYGPDPIKIYGHAKGVTSTYSVDLQLEGDINQYLFTPNGITLNPVLKLYRGQTYTFDINSPGNPFSIKTFRSLGVQNRYLIPGIDNHGVTSGTITFTVPDNAPNILYYQSEEDLQVGGVIEVFDIRESSTLDVENDIIGKKTYTLSDGTALSNGMKVTFGSNVVPTLYATGQYYVEGVGTGIKLILESLLEIVNPYTTDKSVEFDTTPFDIEPFSDSIGFAGVKDYTVINRASRDRNSWSRYNRWFHKDVVEATAKYNNTIPNLDQTARAIRPIIEFEADLKLFNLGTIATVDTSLIDDYTVDVFSTIEGSVGYNIDGVKVTAGQRIIFTADPDPLVKNKIFEVSFINIQGKEQIHLTEVASPVANQTTIILEGVKHQSNMYWFDGTNWIEGQQKTTINQQPAFDVVDNDGKSFGDTSVYNGTTFKGTPLFSYKQNKSSTNNDIALGFPLTYQNVNNIGDIVFTFNLALDSFTYKINSQVVTKKTNVGFLSGKDFGGNTVYSNGWKTGKTPNVQAALRIYKNSNLTNNFKLDIFDDITNLKDLKVRVYVKGNKLPASSWTLVDAGKYKQVVLNTPITTTDLLTIKAFASQPINANGFYEIPINLQNNSLNDDMVDFTLGEVIDHVNSIVDNVSGFSGVFPGVSNLRDLGDISAYGTKFVQHSGPLSLAMYHIASESNNIIKAIETSRDDYNTFKRNFLTVAVSLGVDTDPVKHVELILQELNGNKPTTAPYYFSDMVPYGANITSNLTVVDPRIKTYPLSNAFSLDTLSNKAVGVYLTSNNVKTQLIYGKDYTFSNQSMVVIDPSVQMVVNDTITTIEYDSTDGCFVPMTPTKLGMWPAYVPKIYTDTTLSAPQKVIQGHDGSVMLAYNDYRDDLILELEKRIFNNIKVKYDPTIFDVTDIIPGYNRTTDYSIAEFNQVLAPSFYKWTGFVGVDFSKPLSYDRSNPFTYNYKNNASPNGTSVPGYWRGIYRWMLDTDRPHICPWEMLGFSQEPAWWTKVYGPAPYTSDNLVLWQDLTAGVVREPGVPPKVLLKYVRPFLLDHIPVDETGKLISPLLSGLAAGTLTPDTSDNFIFGDVSPVESAWRRSSYYPFSVIIASLLLTPAKTFGLLLDRSRIVRNLAGQLVYKDTSVHVKPMDIKIPSIYSSATRVQTAGIVNWVVDLILNYIFSNNLNSYEAYAKDLALMTPQLSYRVGAFTNKNQFNLLLESKTPLSTGSVFVPQEDYTVFLNSSSPTAKLTYSGVIITKVPTGGYEIKGYSRTQPYFNYYAPIQSGTSINVGGISENFVTWNAGLEYAAGQVVKYGNSFYRTTSTITAGSPFNPLYFAALDNLPIVGGVTAQFRQAWDKTTTLVLPYSTVLLTVQEVVDFLLGYGQYLVDQGFQFDEYNTNLNTVSNWETSAKEFMFWTTQNWSSGQDKWSEWLPNQSYTYGTIVRFNGEYYSAIYNIPTSDVFDNTQWTLLAGLSNVGASVISLSPAANSLKFTTTLTVVDDINNQFNPYEIFKVDGTPIHSNNLDSYRTGNTVTYSPTGPDGIYCASFYLIQNEHVVIINNTDIFNDIIYSPTSGYRRERIKLSAYVTTNWYGGLDIPGFIFDQASIESWQPWQDYSMGDVIVYQGYYYSANAFTVGTATFMSADWTQLTKKPTPQILPNWTNIATQFTDFYSLDIDSVDSAQQTMAQHLIGYQKRKYLNNIIQDDVSEFKFFQGMIREKGTQNVLNKLFGVLNNDNAESLTFYEEWALRVGEYGANSAFENIELILDEKLVKNNPQGIVLSSRTNNSISSFMIQQTPNDVYLKPLGYDSNPFPIVQNYRPLLRTAGYVNSDDVTFSIGSIDDITKQDITKLSNGQYVWCAFEGASWNIYRFTDLFIRVTDVSYDSGSSTLTISTENIVPITAGSYVGLAQVDILNGFYKVTSTKLNEFTIKGTFDNFPAPFTQAEQLVVFGLLTQRTASIDNLDDIKLNHITPGTIVWTDDSGKGLWASWKYNPIYNKTILTNYDQQDGLNYGRAMAMNHEGTILAVGNSIGTIIIYDRPGVKLNWTERVGLQPPFISSSDRLLPSQVSTVLALSNDGAWLAVGSPMAGYASTAWNLQRNGGVYDNGTYTVENIVLHNQNYYRAVADVPVNIAPSVGSLYWEKIPYVPVDGVVGTNSTLAGQGVISLYKKELNNSYTLVETVVSPHPIANEYFGSTLSFGNDTLYVAASGYGGNNTGRVYKLSYSVTPMVEAAYNPVGSSSSVLVVSSTIGIKAGMVVLGNGFTKGQRVFSVLTKIVFNFSTNLSGVTADMEVSGTNVLPNFRVVRVGSEVSSSGQTTNYVIVQGFQNMNTNITRVEFGGISALTFIVQSIQPMNTLLLDNVPDSALSGSLKFAISGWAYDLSEVYTGVTTGSNLGSSIAINQANDMLVIASASGTSTPAIMASSSISGTTLTVGTLTSGTIYVNMLLTGIGVAENTYIVSGSGSTWVVSVSQQVQNITITGTLTVLGKVDIYRNNGLGFSLGESKIGTTTNFGQGIALSNTGEYLAIADDIFSTDTISRQGTVTVYNYNGEYVEYQTLVNHRPETDGQFGNTVSFMNDDKTLVVYSKNGDVDITTTFDLAETTFDKDSTSFLVTEQNNGRVDVYDRYNTKWVFSESLTTDTQVRTGYGKSVVAGNSHIVVSQPFAVDGDYRSGIVYDYGKMPNTYSWTIDRQEIKIPDVRKIKKAFLYNKTLGTLVKYLDVVDPLQGKIAGPAEEEIKYKTFYDPARYSQGTASVIVNPDNHWDSQQVGQLWWNLNTAKFLNTQFNDPVYRNNAWNTLASGASIDIYEWVSSSLLPAEWDAQADTPSGLAKGISGTSLYGNSAYSISQKYDNISKKFINTYFYWVKNKKVVPNVTGRYMAANDVAMLISDPRGQAYVCLAVTGTNSLSLINAGQYLKDKDIVLSIEYWTIDKVDQNAHSQWKLISNDTIVNIPSNIEQKWFDSLCGVDTAGRDVPDSTLPIKLRYGIENRPRQGMFVNRIEALKEFFERVNANLLVQQISESKDISDLEKYDPTPTKISGKFDLTFDTNDELSYANVGTFTLPTLTPIITNGVITGIVIVNGGKGYVNAPFIEIIGSGIGAVVRSTINTVGTIISATIIHGGEGYNDSTTCTVRSYSALILSDSTSNYTWSIYSYDSVNQNWSRSLTQSYDVRNYWSYVDWYGSATDPDTGEVLYTATQFSGPDISVNTFVDLNSLNDLYLSLADSGLAATGQTVKVLNGNAGKWVLLYRYSEVVSVDWTQTYYVIGIQEGTIQFSNRLYNYNGTDVGYDSNIYDGGEFDIQARAELRIILNALKNKILTDDLKQNYLDLFFTSVHYAHSEQPYIDWIFKTSFVRATHNVGAFTQPVNYPVDNLSNFQDYINEVKPYRTKVREYISQYTNSAVPDNSPSAVTDFDLQPNYENNKIVPINTVYKNNQVESSDPVIQTYPWKFWLDNVGFSIADIVITDQGSNYLTPPVVRITGPSGSGATAKAYITNGRVNRISLLTPGTGYLSAPTVTFDGGLAVGGKQAKGVAIIGNSVVRTNLIGMRFDRVEQTYYINNLSHTDTFTGSGSRLQFQLTWAPDIRVGESSVTINGVPVLREFYKLAVVKSKASGYTQYSGIITFDASAIPSKNSTVIVKYKKDIGILSATDRIQYYYNPTAGQLGKDLSQLMTGIDYGGVNVNGLGFNISGGWDVSPFLSETWDSRDPTFNDYFVQVGENNHVFILPYTPANNTNINIYYVKKNTVSYDSDAISTKYQFDINWLTPSVNVTIPVNTVGVHTTYTGSPVINPGPTISVASTTGIVSGMLISGSGFNSRQTVIRIINSTTISISGSPESVPNGTLTFSNIAGGKVLSIASTSGLKVGDIVTSAGSTFNFETKIASIDTTNHYVLLDQIILSNILDGTVLTFTRTLVEPTDVIINSNGSILLSEVYPVGTTINITGTSAPVRLDDPYYTLYDGTTTQPNGRKVAPIGAIMPTPIVGRSVITSQVEGGAALVVSFATLEDGGTAGSTFIETLDGTTTNDAVTNVIEIPETFIVNSGDEFILRQSTSDGSIPIPESDYDTAISGGDLAYSTATGLAADDIVADGDGFVTPTSSPAPEEVVPGQIVDTLAVKVYDRSQSGSANIRVVSHITDGISHRYSIEHTPNSQRSIIVKVGDEIKTYGTLEDYTVDYSNKQIVFNSVLTANQVVTIYSIGFSGSNILDIDYFVGDGRTVEFVTKASWLDTVTSLVYVDGIATSVELFKTDSSYAFTGAIGLRFTIPPTTSKLINYIIVSGNQQTFAITKTETVLTDGRSSSTPYALQFPIGNSLPNESNMIVRVDQDILQAPNNSYFKISNNRLTYTVNPTKALPGTQSVGNIFVYANGNLLVIGRDYTVDPNGISVKINKTIYKQYSNGQLLVSLTENAGYIYNQVAGEITFAHSYNNTHVVEVISSYVHDVLDIQRTSVAYTSSVSLTPGTVEFYAYNEIGGGILHLDRPVIDNQYIWVVKNTTLLTPSIDYKLNDDLQTITLAVTLTVNDSITLITFGSNVLPASGISYMQFKDMLNRVSYKRLNLNKRTKLAEDLRWNDTTIVVEDASNLDVPNRTNNRPGIIEIRGERIEYFTINGNVLGQLRRGTLGTGVYNLNRTGTYVQGIGASETIPYTDNTTTELITSSGGTTIDLGFIPASADSIEVFVGGYNSLGNWKPNTSYVVGDIVNIGSYTYRCVVANTSSSVFEDDATNWHWFVGNIRLKKSPYSVFNINNGPYSPKGDVAFPADFVVPNELPVWRKNVDITLNTYLYYGNNCYLVTNSGRTSADVPATATTVLVPATPPTHTLGVVKNGTASLMFIATFTSQSSIILRNALGFGTRVTVVKRTGTAWDSATNILNDTSSIANFIKSAPGVWYSDYKQLSNRTGASTFDSAANTFDSGNSTFDQG
jgi:hypothetical protein